MSSHHATIGSRLPWTLGALTLLVALLTALPPAASPGEASSCLPPPAGITGWWPGDGNTDDIVGGFDATLEFGATTGPGLVGDAFHLDGIDDFVSVPDDPALDPGTGDFTVDAWVWFDSLGGEQVMLEKYIETGAFTPPGWTLTKLPNDSILFGSGPLPSSFATASLPLAPNTWIHVAARRSGNTGSIFVNGVLEASGPIVHDTSSSSSLKFGHRGNPADTPGSGDARGFYLEGRIDEVEYFVGTALTDAQIAAIYNAGPDGKCKVLDTTPPTLGPCPVAGPFLLNSGLQPITGMLADDPETPIDVGASTLQGMVDTSSVGTKTVTFTAVNEVGLSATKDCEYVVQYAFEGFFAPVDNEATNVAKAGQTVVLKWRLTDALGEPVDDPASFIGVSTTATPAACGGVGAMLESAAGSSGLQYLGDGVWQFNWKTPKAYSGQCRTMSLDLADGASNRIAEFEFK